MTTAIQLDTSTIPNRIWFVNDSDGTVNSTWSSRRLARMQKRTLATKGNTGVSISYSTVTIGTPVTDSHS